MVSPSPLGHCPLIQADNITARARHRDLLSEVSCVADERECVALLGANGSGKSLVIQVFGTAKRATSGSALVAGVDVRRKPREARRRVGYVMETPAFPDHTDVAEYMKAMAASHRLPREDRAEADALLTDLSRGEA